MAAGQLFYGPAIDRWGRRRPLIVGTLLFAVTSALLTFAPDIHSFIALRFVEAIGGCAGMIIARAIIRDVYDLGEASAMLSQMMLVQGLGPVLAPILGSQIIAHTSWHWIFGVLAVSGVFWCAMVWWGLPETLPREARRATRIRDLLTAFAGLLKRPDFILPAAVAAAAMGSIFAFIGGSAFVFMQHFGLGREAYSLVFGANAVCMIIAAQINRILVRRVTPARMVLGATGFAATAGVVVLALAPGAPLMLFVVPLFLALGTAPIIGANAQAIAMSRSGEFAGTASSLIGIIQYSVAGAVIAVVGALHDGTAIPMAATIVVSYAVSLTFAGWAHIRGRL
jgi:DHA1 family bicyclomycin/chloramphenicol resistance-like MFS transporter